MTEISPEHPCYGLSKACIDAFERIAINREPGCSQRTIQKLLDLGLIRRL